MVDVVQMLKRGQLAPLGKVDNEIDKFNYTNCTIKLNSLNLETFKVVRQLKRTNCTIYLRWLRLFKWPSKFQWFKWTECITNFNGSTG